MENHMPSLTRLIWVRGFSLICASARVCLCLSLRVLVHVLLCVSLSVCVYTLVCIKASMLSMQSKVKILVCISYVCACTPAHMCE